MRWFALRVKARHEKSVTANLTARRFVSFTPLYTTTHQWTDRRKSLDLPLFPGYVFSRFQPEDLASILNTPGVFDAVRFGARLAPIDDEEIEALQTVLRTGCKAEPAPYFPAGDVVWINSGPLAGLRGTVINNKDRSGSRLILSVTLLQRSVQVDVDRLCLLADEPPAPRKPTAILMPLTAGSQGMLG